MALEAPKFSPMLTHALESFEHGLEHYVDGTSKSRKFALLHLDHAVELLLKEKCVRLGKSIYKNDRSTLSIHEAFNSIKKENVIIEEQPILEELHDLRNTIQHKGLVPDEFTADFHVHNCYRFVKRFTSKELELDFTEVLPRRYRALIEGAQESVSSEATVPESGISTKELEKLSAALRDAWEAENYTTQIISAYSVLQQAVYLLAGADAGDPNVKFRRTLRDAAVSRGVEQRRIDKKLKVVLILRGMAMNQEHETTEKEAIGYLRATEAVLKLVGLTEAVERADAGAQQIVEGDI